MSVWFVVVSVLAAVNPPRVAARLTGTAVADRRRPVVIGSALAGVVLLALALMAEPILRGLELSEETWKIASGAVAVLAAARHLVFGASPAVPPLDPASSGLVPVAFPLVLAPEVVLLAVLYGATESVGLVVASLIAALGAVVVWPDGDGFVSRGVIRLLAAVLVVVGVGLMVAGIRDV